MYLSRLILNSRIRRVQREIADSYQMHKTLMRCFPDDIDCEKERVLFRVDADPRTGVLTVLLQSTIEPRWSWLDAQRDGAHSYLLRPPETKSFDLNFAPGQMLAFRLRANPTVKRKVEDKRNGRRIGLHKEEEQRQWLNRKAEQGGFRVLSARTGNQTMVSGRIRKKGTTHKLRLLSVQFDGLLQATDPDRLRETVQRGVGSGKGLGFGLLSLARPSA